MRRLLIVVIFLLPFLWCPRAQAQGTIVSGSSRLSGNSVLGGGHASGGGTASLSQNPINSTGGTSADAVITLTQAITAGQAIMIYANFASSGFQITGTNNGGTYIRCSSLVVPCNGGPNTGSGFIDGGYILSASSQSSTIQINFSASVNWNVVAVYVYTDTGGLGTFAFDTSGFLSTTSGSSPQAGPTLTLTGTNDVIFGACGTDNGVSAISSPWTDLIAGPGIATSLNTSSGTAPSWTSAGSTDWACLSIALKVQ